MAESVSDVLLFVPNQIGFIRIILAILSFSLSLNPLAFCFLYVTSQLLDAVDGFAARYFNQTSRFGGLLDQLTDRCSFLGLLFCLSKVYPAYTFQLTLVAIIDISSHWAHLYASLLMGKTSHKTKQDNVILNVYYTNKKVLFALCFGNEAFFVCLFTSAFVDSFYLTITSCFIKLSAPLMLSKVIVNIIQGFEAFKIIAMLDLEKRLID